MATIVQCEKCGKEKSKNANACPHCGYRIVKKSQMAKCRACGTLLEKAVHRSRIYGVATRWIDGTSSSYGITSVEHQPCTKCGEPKPLRYLFWGSFFSTIIVLAVTGGCTVYGFSIWPRNDQPDVAEKMYTIGGLVLAWIIFMLIAGRYNTKHEKG
jgi:hypothetical protein